MDSCHLCQHLSRGGHEETNAQCKKNVMVTKDNRRKQDSELINSMRAVINDLIPGYDMLQNSTMMDFAHFYGSGIQLDHSTLWDFHTSHARAAHTWTAKYIIRAEAKGDIDVF